MIFADKKKKLAPVVLGCIICIGSVLPAEAIEFADIDDVPWHAAVEYVNKVADAGLMIGDMDEFGNRTFRPCDSVTYCETAQLIYTLLSTYNGNTATTDMMEKYANWMNDYMIPIWVQPAVSYCMSQGILMASDLAYFCPDGISALASREKVALYFGRGLSRMIPISTSAILNFNDAVEISSNEVPYIDVMVRAGIISGDDYGNFNPKNNITRTEMAIIAVRTHDYLLSI